MPRSRPCSSKARAKMRCSFDTPAPVIQCFTPLMNQLSPRRSARVRIEVASEPASGSVMQMAGLSPARTSCAAQRFCASLPKAMTVEMAPILPSTTIRAVTVQARAISSTTTATSRKSRPWPPHSTGTDIPMKPCSASRRTMSQGYSRSRSMAAARGATYVLANCAARSRKAWSMAGMLTASPVDSLRKNQ